MCTVVVVAAAVVVATLEWTRRGMSRATPAAHVVRTAQLLDRRDAAVADDMAPMTSPTTNSSVGSSRPSVRFPEQNVG